jgi:hypothetical protein
MIPACAAGVEQRQVVGVDINRQGVITHCLGEAGNLVDRLALHAQAGHQGADLGVGDLPGHDRVHGGCGFRRIELLPIDNGLDHLLDIDFLHGLPCHIDSNLVPKDRCCFWRIDFRTAHREEIAKEVLADDRQD